MWFHSSHFRFTASAYQWGWWSFFFIFLFGTFLCLRCVCSQLEHKQGNVWLNSPGLKSTYCGKSWTLAFIINPFWICPGGSRIDWLLRLDIEITLSSSIQLNELVFILFFFRIGWWTPGSPSPPFLSFLCQSLLLCVKVWFIQCAVFFKVELTAMFSSWSTANLVWPKQLVHNLLLLLIHVLGLRSSWWREEEGGLS